MNVFEAIGNLGNDELGAKLGAEEAERCEQRAKEYRRVSEAIAAKASTDAGFAIAWALIEVAKSIDRVEAGSGPDNSNAIHDLAKEVLGLGQEAGWGLKAVAEAIDGYGEKGR
jgi:hypothetical protein